MEKCQRCGVQRLAAEVPDDLGKIVFLGLAEPRWGMPFAAVDAVVAAGREKVAQFQRPAILCDGDVVAVQGFRGEVYLNSRWQFAVNGLYQLPHNFTIAANFSGREGYPINWFRNVGGAVDRVRAVSVVPVGSQRYGDLFELDMQVGYIIRLFGTGTMTLTASCFNVPNNGTVLQRQNRLKIATTNDVFEIQSPRVARFGAQISF